MISPSIGYECTKHLFALLVRARGERKQHIYEQLLYQADPTVLLGIALSEYDRYGNEDRLTLTASLLTDMGGRSFPALRAFAQLNPPEYELFTDVLAYLRDVSIRDRLEALSYLIRNPSSDVRYSLLGALKCSPLWTRPHCFKCYRTIRMMRSLKNHGRVWNPSK